MVIRYGASRAWTTLGGPLGLLGPASTDLVRWPQNCCDDTKAVVLGTILAAPSIEFQLALNIDTSPTNELGRQGFGLGSERGDSNPKRSAAPSARGPSSSATVNDSMGTVPFFTWRSSASRPSRPENAHSMLMAPHRLEHAPR